jgi:hypothetical protein
MNLRGRIARLEQRTGGRPGVSMLFLDVPNLPHALAVEGNVTRPCPDEEVGALLARAGPYLKILIGINPELV